MCFRQGLAMVPGVCDIGYMYLLEVGIRWVTGLDTYCSISHIESHETDE